MLANCTAVLRSSATTTDEYGDSSSTTSDTTLAWALIAPRASSERVDSRSPAVLTAATIYGPFGTPINADDLFVVSGHSPSMDGTWLVEGRSGDWSLGSTEFGFECAVKRASGQ